MTTPAGPIASYRRWWLPELLALILAAVFAAVLFAFTSLDIAAQRPYYHPGLSHPWPVADHPAWKFFYRSAPWVTGSLALAGTVLLIAGLVNGNKRQFRLWGIFLLLTVATGPGLVVNAVLKDHWGRPRPRQVAEFGGRLPYSQPLVPTAGYGKSFPCGHCSVGYLYAAGWWIWRRRRPALAALSLAAGLVLGTLLGFGRMAAGAHFLSDAVWSALIAYAIAHGLYYYVLRIPAREDSRPALYPLIEGHPRRKAAVIMASLLFGLAIIGGGVLASPHFMDLEATVPLGGRPAAPQVLEVRAGTLDVDLRIVDGPSGVVRCSGDVHGFGLPTNRLRWAWDFEQAPVPLLRFRVVQQGWFTDLDGIARIRVPAGGFRRIVVRLERGDITVSDERVGERRALPVLDLATGRGQVIRLQ